MALPIDECDEYRDNGLTQQLGFIRTCEWKWPDFLAPFLKIKVKFFTTIDIDQPTPLACLICSEILFWWLSFFFLQNCLRDAVKNYLADFFR